MTQAEVDKVLGGTIGGLIVAAGPNAVLKSLQNWLEDSDLIAQLAKIPKSEVVALLQRARRF